MALFECNACHHVQETPNVHIGRKAMCPICKEIGVICDTVLYVKELTEKYRTQKELLGKIIEDEESIEIGDDILETYDVIPPNDFDVHNTDIFSDKNHYYPIIEWFREKHIQALIDPKMMDTTGFFDEVAIYIGDHFNIAGPIVNQIRYAQSKKYDKVKVSLSHKTPQEVKQILAFTTELYKFSFVAKSHSHKKNNVIYLTLQDIPIIKSFFDGLWMEWFALVKLISFFKDKNLIPPIARSVKITFPNFERNELDIFFLNHRDEPVYVECKTGEFRKDLNKYLNLKKKLNIKKENFILCVFGLDAAQARGLTSMYEITIVSEAMLVDHVASHF